MSAAITAFEPFRSLGRDAHALLAQGLIQKAARRNEAMVHKGQPVSGAYVVLAGRLRVFTIAPNGTEATLYAIEPGETCVLALNCVFNDLLYPAWVQAEMPSTVAIIPGAVYRRLFDTEPDIRAFTVKTLATLVFRLMGELEQVHASPHRQRLAQFILQRAAGDGTLRLTQQQIAGHLGTTREVIARLMQEFVARGLVRTARGSVSIRDLFALRALLTPVVLPATRPRGRR